MTGADHRCKLAAGHDRIGGYCAEPAYPSFARKCFSTFESRVGIGPQFLGHVARDSRLVQRRCHTPVSIATSCQRAGLGFGIGPVVDITGYDAVIDNSGYRRSAFVGPATLFDFARQIFGQLGLCRCVAPDITDRECSQLRRIERARTPGGSGS